MNKKEFAEIVKTENAQKDINISVKETWLIVDSVFQCMQDVIEKEGEFIILKFGKFSLQTSKERKGRNPHSGKQITIPEKIRLKFKTSSTFKHLLNHDK